MTNTHRFGKVRRAFSLVELLISIAIISIVGGASVMALNTMLLAFAQNDDYIAARSEVEFAFNELRPQFTNIGLGMPNNRSDKGSFGVAFTVGTGTPVGTMTAPVEISGDAKGLFYAYAVPTGVRVNIGSTTSNLKLTTDDIDTLVALGLAGGDADNANSWVLFPSLRVPFHVTTVGADNLTVEVHEGFKVELNGYEEIHLLRVGRLDVEGRELKQQINNAAPKTIATSISVVSFDFPDPQDKRDLKMTITAHGNAGERHTINETMTWRIIN